MHMNWFLGGQLLFRPIVVLLVQITKANHCYRKSSSPALNCNYKNGALDLYVIKLSSYLLLGLWALQLPPPLTLIIMILKNCFKSHKAPLKINMDCCCLCNSG